MLQMKRELLQQQQEQMDILRQTLPTQLDRVKEKESVAVHKDKEAMELALQLVS